METVVVEDAEAARVAALAAARLQRLRRLERRAQALTTRARLVRSA